MSQSFGAKGAAILAFGICSAPLVAETRAVEPLITKEKIAAVASKCDAKVTVSEAPGYNEQTGAIEMQPMLVIEVQRSNPPTAIACVRSHIPTVVTMLVGRENGVRPIDQKALDAILKNCGWESKDGQITLEDDDELHFQPKPSANFERVDCVLRGVRPYAPKMGFIGNEAAHTKEEKK